MIYNEIPWPDNGANNQSVVLFNPEEQQLMDEAMLLLEVTGYTGNVPEAALQKLRQQGGLRKLCREAMTVGTYDADLLDIMACALRQYSSYRCRNAQWGCKRGYDEISEAACKRYMSEPFGRETFFRDAQYRGMELFDQEKIRACCLLAHRLESLKCAVNPYDNYGLFQQEEYIIMEMALDFVLYKQEQVLRLLGMPEASAKEASIPLTRLQEGYFRMVFGNHLSVEDSKLLQWVVGRFREKVTAEIAQCDEILCEPYQWLGSPEEVQVYQQHVSELRELQTLLEGLEGKMLMFLPRGEHTANTLSAEQMIPFEEEMTL